MRLIVKSFLLVVLLLIGMIADSAAVVITNELAMTQLENSNILLVAMDTYIRLRPIISFAYGVIVCLVAFSVAKDLTKFAKSSN